MNENYFDVARLPKFVKVTSKHGPKSCKKTMPIVDISKSNNPILTVTLICILLALLQFSLGLASYSGCNKPPMYGDYEAQRHWMEITVNLPLDKWYVNGTDNDLLYWGLDYPPLTAYHHLLLGKISNLFNPQWISLHSSRGFESASHKLFMRISAIVPFFMFYVPAIIYFAYCIVLKNKRESIGKLRLLLVSFCLLYPGLLVIDNAHFQYNSISLGFFLISYCFLTTNHSLIGSIFFVLALNYKQMELYHSLPIFFFILARSIKKPFIENLPSSIIQIMKVGLIVCGCFFVIWIPFIYNGTYKDVIIRVFPFNRGLYEDKVASFWCAFSFILKRMPESFQSIQIGLSTCFVLLASMPSLYYLFRRPTDENFRLSLLTTSLSFFLFSFHVHEKTILLAAVCAMLLYPEYPKAVLWFLNITNISLYSLCIKDENPSFIFLFIAYFVAHITTHEFKNDLEKRVQIASVLFGFIICILELYGPIPSRFPNIYQLANAFYSCIHFMGFLGYFTFTVYKNGQHVSNNKLKSN